MTWKSPPAQMHDKYAITTPSNGGSLHGISIFQTVDSKHFNLMTPNITKAHTDTSRFFHTPPQSEVTTSTANMDGDHSAKTMDQGANAATNAVDQTDGLHEDAKPIPALGKKETGGGISVFSKDGAIGSAFTAQGAVGGTAHNLGGPFDQKGMVGQAFNADGAIGGIFQELAKKNEQH